MIRKRISLQGIIQGVGFRPFVHKLALELGLSGHVCNNNSGVMIEIQGSRKRVNDFINRLDFDKPEQAQINQQIVQTLQSTRGEKNFSILSSEVDFKGNLGKCAEIAPDLATCQQCLKEIFDPHNRRFRYPFTNCTHCGPRYSIIESLPYDRHKTTMKNFKMCDDCQREYDDPHNRRYHAQPNACLQCGPQLEYWNSRGELLLSNFAAIQQAILHLKQGKIIAIKGLGGFHLLVDPQNFNAVAILRNQKLRKEKPFALLCPHILCAQELCHLQDLEKKLLSSQQAPIVLLRKRNQLSHYAKYWIADNVAPNNPYLGIMLPYTPLHHLLMHSWGRPLIATSGNISDDPLCLHRQEALFRLKGLADFFLVHNRPITRHIDDSVLQVVEGRIQFLRRARGYTPSSITLKNNLSNEKNDDFPKILAVGGHLKNTFAIMLNDKIIISQHLGDLENAKSAHTFENEVTALLKTYEMEPQLICCDLHPNYFSTQYATHLSRQDSVPLVFVQHHLSHILSCVIEQQMDLLPSGKVLGISWDGTGLGLDGNIWGGEFIEVNTFCHQATRRGHFRYFPLPGGQAAMGDPRRSALGLLYSVYSEKLQANKMRRSILSKLFEDNELELLIQTLDKKINCPLTSSVGRLFDGISALIGLRTRTSFEGQAAMDLEFALGFDNNFNHINPYPHSLIVSHGATIIDWQDVIISLLKDLENDISHQIISYKFHHFLVETILQIAKIQKTKDIILSGGCFQNRYLLKTARLKLIEAGFKPHFSESFPPNDGGLCLGQIAASQTKWT